MLAVSSVCVAAIVASIFLGDVPDFTDPQAVRSGLRFLYFGRLRNNLVDF